MARERRPEQAMAQSFPAYVLSRRLLLAMLLGFGVLIVAATVATRVSGSASDASAPFTGAKVEPPRSLPSLTLERADGTAWTSADTYGRLSLVFFGYTNCPDVCPLTLSRARQIYQQLGTDAALVDVYFITVDPERDAPERLARYVSQFDPDFIGLTGTTDQLQAAMSTFGVVAVQQAGAGSAAYSVDHTASSYLLDDRGRIRLIYPFDAPGDGVLHDIQTILAE